MVKRLPLVLLASVLLMGETRAAAPNAVPANMQGVWGWDSEACRDPNSDGRATVAADSVMFFASKIDFTPDGSVTVDTDGTVRASGVIHEEGYDTTSTGSITLKLLAPDRLQFDPPDHAYVRCAK